MLRKAPVCMKLFQRIQKPSLINLLLTLGNSQSQKRKTATLAIYPVMLPMKESENSRAIPCLGEEINPHDVVLETNEDVPAILGRNEKKRMKQRKKKMKKGGKDKQFEGQSDRSIQPEVETKMAQHEDLFIPFDMSKSAVNAQPLSHSKSRNSRSEIEQNPLLKNLNQLQSSKEAGNGVLENVTPTKAFLEYFESPTTPAAPHATKKTRSGKGSSHKRGYHSETTPNKNGGLPKMNCSEYWPLARVEEAIKAGTVVTGSFRINQRNYTSAYVTAPNGQRDILIEGIDQRNRAMHGDFVAVELISDEDSVKKEAADITRRLAAEFGRMQITEERLKNVDQTRGRVVRILEKKHCRKAAGILKQYRQNAYGFALLSPQDSRLPRIMIPLSECPEDFISRPQDFQNVLFIGEIVNWKPTCAMASGKLIKQLGDCGDIEPETEGFLAEYNVDDGPFPEEALACLPTDLPWKIPAEELATRRDLRDECIFTIDPSTARDLDDALSIKQREDGNFEVGVHIADVSYFIEEGNALDVVASRRATSVYLVQRVVPMLPRLLCEQLCSLNPGADKLTYSVIWSIRPDGKIIDEWFGRTVIRSSTKLSYEHAQQMIETADVNILDWLQFPEIDGHHVGEIHTSVRRLYELSLLLRKKRFDSGALNLNQPKMTFTLDKETGQPNGFGSYVARDSNRLVEEFMLLANMAVAHRLVRSLPEHAMLRRHPAPHPKMLEDLLTLCKRCEVSIDAATSHSLHSSLERLKQFDSAEKEALYFAVVSLCSKPMQLAKYFCAGAIDDEKSYHHYALNVPLYTHFTSPIRRYPDVIVHRMLTVALEDDGKVSKDVQQLQKLAEECNDKKASAKKVQELSSELFFTNYIRQLGELREQAVIIGMLDSAVDVLLLHTGLVKRIYCNALPLHSWKADKEEKDSMTLYWKDEDEEIGNENEALDNYEAGGRIEASKRGEETKTDKAKSGKEASQVKKSVGKNCKDTEPSKENGTPNQSEALNEVKAGAVCKEKGNRVGAVSSGERPAGSIQVLRIFDRLDVILRSEEDKGSHKIKVYIPKPEKN